MINQELKEQFITHDFNLPNHRNELSKADSVIDKHKRKLEAFQANGNIDDKSHTELFEEIVRALIYVGRLSEPAFEIGDELEAMYTLQFKHSPSLAKQLWLEHYEDIHRPYTVLKNRCYRLLDMLDEEYIKVHKKNPPNFNI
jgi:hypothetical protein